MFRAILAIVLAVMLVAFIPPVTEQQTAELVTQPAKPFPKRLVQINLSLIRQILCKSADENGQEHIFTGTGVVIAKNTIMTANHVLADGEECWDLGTNEAIIPYYQDGSRDFALARFDTGELDEFIQYSCEGFIAGENYLSIGVAWGEVPTMNPLRAKGDKTPFGTLIDKHPAAGLQILYGSIIPGMSGGPIFDQTGVVIGINSATGTDRFTNEPLGLSRDLKDTVLCDLTLRSPAGDQPAVDGPFN